MPYTHYTRDGGNRLWDMAADKGDTTDEYRGEMDVIGNFLKESCIRVPGSIIRIRDLLKAYQEWCEKNNKHAYSERFLSLRSKEIGYEKTRTAEARYWSDIALRAKQG